MAPLNQNLLDAYKQTEYRILEPAHCIYIGQFHPQLDLWLEHLQASTWAFLTADNPYSDPQPLARNQAALKKLKWAIKHLHLPAFAAEGADPSGEWPPEQSLWVPDIRLAQARLLGQQFGQHAFVWGEKAKAAELILLSDAPAA